MPPGFPQGSGGGSGDNNDNINSNNNIVAKEQGVQVHIIFCFYCGNDL